MAMLCTPADNAELVVGHGECDLLFKDPSLVVEELLCDVNATGDGASGIDFCLQLVCLCDLQPRHAPRDQECLMGAIGTRTHISTVAL